MSEMRITFDATVMEQCYSGVANYILGIYDACLKILPSLEIAALHRKSLAGALPQEIADLRIGKVFPRRLWRSVVLPAYLSVDNQSIVHFPWNGDVPRFVHANLVVSTIHDVLPLAIPGYFRTEMEIRHYRKSMQSSINRTGILLTGSEYSKRELVKNFQVKTEPVVIHNATNLGKNTHNQGRTDEATSYFLYVGGYDKRKGLEQLLKVFINLHRERAISSKLVLVGQKIYFSDAFDKLIRVADKMGIVTEAGYVPDCRLESLYSNATALVYLSKYEGFGLPPLEAMTLGCPVITTRHTSIPEVCGDAAFYVEPDDEIECARALVQLEGKADLRNRMAVEGRRQAAKYSWAKSAGTFLESLTRHSGSLSVQ